MNKQVNAYFQNQSLLETTSYYEVEYLINIYKYLIDSFHILIRFLHSNFVDKIRTNYLY